MAKVIKIFLNHGFTPINQNVFKLGTTIDFDCYIKRFNGFVILIEKGTLLDEKIYKKITNHNLQIYVENKSYTKYKKYSFQHRNANDDALEKLKNLSFDDEIAHCNDIKQILSSQADTSEKLKIIYESGKNLLNAWILKKEEKVIPLEALKSLVESLVDIMNQEDITLSDFNGFLDEVYSLAAHLVKVSFFTAIIANKIKLDISDQENVSLAAIIHDVGKCDLDESLLDKPDFLTQAEFKVIQEHVAASVRFAKRSGLKDRIILNAIKEHHERLDGSGYPNALVGKRIGQFGMILAVCDVFDALITQKPYRGAYSTFNASSLLRDEYKNKLDMKYINILIKNLK